MITMREVNLKMGFILIGLLLLSPTAIAGEFTVIPGHSLGRIWLGAPHFKVRKIMGRPYLIQRDRNLTIEFWRIKKSTSDYVSAVYEHTRVIQIETNSRRFSTPRGVSVQSKLGYIRKSFGCMRVVSFGMNDRNPDIAEHSAHYFDSAKHGIAFELDMGARPNVSKDTVPHALFVHRRGQQFRLVIGKEVWAEDTQK
jgi:hypothetical protein